MAASPVHPKHGLGPGMTHLKEGNHGLASPKAVIGKMPHDFNNFLVPIFGYLTLISDEVSGNLSAAEYAAAMETAARSTEKHLETILLAVRPQRHFSPREMDLSALLK